MCITVWVAIRRFSVIHNPRRIGIRMVRCIGNVPRRGITKAMVIWGGVILGRPWDVIPRGKVSLMFEMGE